MRKIIRFGDDMNVVYGGVFNPPTIAHENAIKKVLKTLSVERFIVVPVGSTYDYKEVDGQEHRFNMVRIMCEDVGVEVSRIEYDADKYEGSLSLLQKLNLKDSKFLIGSDNLETIHKWINPDKLLADFGLVVLSRQSDVHKIIDQNELLRKYKHNIVVIEDFTYDISSTMFRDTRDFSLVSKKIKKYIIDYDLYGG